MIEAFLKINGKGWSADVWQTEGEKGFFHIIAYTKGDSKESASSGVSYVLDFFAANRRAWIRVRPEVNTEKNFITNEETYHGFVRFTFRFERGEWENFHADSVSIPSIGNAT